MPFVKDPLALLIEASNIDIGHNTKDAIRESTVRSAYGSIEEAAEPVIYGPEVVPVIRVGENYYTEMNFLHPYMSTNFIHSVKEALDNVAEANGLQKGSIGILIESEECVSDAIQDAIESGNVKKKDNLLKKVDKAVGISDKLKKVGVDVKKKKPVKCPDCGKVKCECGGRGGKKVCPECGKVNCECGKK